MENQQLTTLETITLGGGCFWCLDAVFRRVQGVGRVECGYSNGQIHNPEYEQVCAGETGHAEVVQVEFDPQQVSLEQLLAVFFSIHDPTSLKQQGADCGTQYRSAIYWSEPEQLPRILAVMTQAKEGFQRPVVTELAQLANYWPAEPYHQDYFAKHPGQGYCAAIIGPKVQKFQATFKSLLG